MSTRWTIFEYEQYLKNRRGALDTLNDEALTRQGQEPEAHFMARVIALAKSQGYLCYHTFNSQRSEAGFPDLVMSNGHSTLFVELKKDKGKLTEDQQRWLSMLGNAGEEVKVWRPHMWEEIMQRLTRRIEEEA